MSWFQDLAGKAENMLNKLDQNAATVLQQQQQAQQQEQSSGSSSAYHDDEIQTIIEHPNENDQLVEIKCEKSENTPSKRGMSLSKSLAANKLKLAAATSSPQLNYFNEKVDLEQKSSQSVAMEQTSYRSNSSTSSKADGVTILDAGSSVSANEPITLAIDSKLPPADRIPQQLPAAPSFPTVASSNDIGNVKNELAAVKIVLNEVKLERDELRLELENVTEQMKNANTKLVIKELEDVCNGLSEEKDLLMVKYEALEKSNFNYVKSISELETKLSKCHQIEIDLNSKLEWAKREAEQSTYELQQYRARAQNTLQMKEQLIEQLKGASSAGTSEVPSNNVMNYSLEVENLKSEKLGFIEEIRILNSQLEQIRSYVDKLEQSQKEQQRDFENKINLLNINLRQEERKWKQFDDEYKTQERELSTVREEMLRLQTVNSNLVHEKEIEIMNLRSKMSQRNFADSTNGLEERVQSLTQSLVQKQNSLESVTADRNALRLQLEKIENQHRTTVQQLRLQRPQIINVNDTDDAKARVPAFFQENPFDTRVARRVKRAYSSLDSVGVHIGVFLRRYPLVRILTIFYVVLLHLWVMVVLCSSTPN